MYYIISVLLGLLPEVLYFTAFLCSAKKLKTKRFLLFGLISVSYSVFVLLLNYQILRYTLFIFSLYIILKLLYKEKAYLADIFIFSVATLFLMIISGLCYFLIPNYWLSFVVARIALFALLASGKSHARQLYLTYLSLWNRQTEKKVKSITLRNISLILLNIILLVFSTILSFILSMGGG